MKQVKKTKKNNIYARLQLDARANSFQRCYTNFAVSAAWLVFGWKRN